MHEEEFIEVVRRDAPLGSEEDARDVVDATLETLGERIGDGAAADVAQHLPDDVAEPLLDAEPEEATPFSREQFTERVADRAGLAVADVPAYTRPVAGALARAAGTEFEDAREQLPGELDVLLEPGGSKTLDEFLATVEVRGDLDSREDAEAATNATLRTLGERLTEGEAADLSKYLPPELQGEIVPEKTQQARDYSFDEFTARVAEREDVPEETAETHARAVGSALAEVASEREVDAARKQLPDPFGVVFDPPE